MLVSDDIINHVAGRGDERSLSLHKQYLKPRIWSFATCRYTVSSNTFDRVRLTILISYRAGIQRRVL